MSPGAYCKPSRPSEQQSQKEREWPPSTQYTSVPLGADQSPKCSTACDQTERATRKHEERVAMCACRFGRINSRRTN